MKSYTIIFLVFFCSLLSCRLSKVDDVIQPKACFVPDKTTCPVEDCTILFDASCTQNATNYQWYLNDGNGFTPFADNNKQVVNVFEKAGTYIIKLVVENGVDFTDSITTNIQVRTNEDVPRISFELSKQDCFTPCDVSMVNYDDGAGGKVEELQWDFGDPNSEDDVGTTAVFGNITHTYHKPGTFVATLSANGPGGNNEHRDTIFVVDSMYFLTPIWDNDLKGVASENYSIEVQLTSATLSNVEGVEILFEVTDGTGKVNGNPSATSLTNSEGIARATWTLSEQLCEQQEVNVKVVSSFIIVNSVPFSIKTDYFKDTRDDKLYRVVEYNGEKWMAENLNYNANNTIGVCFNNNEDNCDECGRLYLWTEVAQNPAY